jgi:sugar fermentation stimulation protein A
MTSFFYPYPPLKKGVLVRRYQRFLADIQLDSGEMITAHCPNTGPMLGVCQAGSPVYVSQSDNSKRKYAYTWELIAVAESWVGINTSLPNKVIKNMLLSQALPELKGQYETVRSEVPYGQLGKSRIDFLLGHPHQKSSYVEVKNTTLSHNNCALFPDTVTTRGQKHLQELMALLPHHQAIMLYFINRGDCTEFAPGDEFDPSYGQLLRQAIALGVKVLPCRFEVSPRGLSYQGLASLKPLGLE